MITSKQITDIISQDDPLASGLLGKLESMKRFGLGQNRMGGSGGSIEQRRFIADLQAQLATPRTPAEKYHHPQDDAKIATLTPPLPPGVQNPGNDLSPADLAWINRLPADPAQVIYDDAVHLAALALASSSFKDKSGARLIQSVWAPVKEVHDGRAAEVALRNARRPLPEIPSSVLGALTDAVSEEVPQLEPDEAVTRASGLLREALDRRSAAREAKAQQAEAAIEQARQATANRTRLVKA